MDRCSPLIDAAGLQAQHDPVLLDARPGDAGRRSYEQAHLRGAFHVDLDRDLAAPVCDARHGGRHPLPDPVRFCALLGELGVAPGRGVVVYDDQGGAMAAARAWWLLRALGHAAVWVLDGGFPAALNARLPTEHGDADARPDGRCDPYPATGFDHMPQVDASQLEQARQDPSRRVLDVRARERFEGLAEPIDPVAGHIPGARNVPLTENLTADGRFRSSEALRALYEAQLDGVPASGAIVHCGSGVTACHTLLALEHAGLPGAALYVGSWSEWCRSPRPRAP